MQPDHNVSLSWTRPSDLRAQVQKLWDRGRILASFVNGQALFPKRLALRTPTSADMTERFDDVRAWIQELLATPHCRVEMRPFRHRILGSNLAPNEAWIDTVQDALALIGKQRDTSRFCAVLEATREQQPGLLDWLLKHPLDGLRLSGEWDRLLEVVAWVKERPRPGIYLRQVDIPGIHTKFLEAHLSVLSELLDIVLSPDAIDATASRVTDFSRRYGFLEKPIRVRFRVLDPTCGLLSGGPGHDITLDGESFARLNPGVSRVFITENEINFLAFPGIDDSLIVFGSGYGFAALGKAKWLSRCQVYYWGDIDTHGFAILDQLRGQFDAVQSFLMDRATLMEFESQWDIEDKQTVHELHRLNSDELSVYDDLRDNRIRKNLRLEQERISFGWVASRLSALK